MTNLLVAGAKCALRQKIDDFEYWRRRRRYQVSRIGRETDREIVRGLRSKGGYVSSLEELALPGTAEMLKAADELFGLIADRVPGKGGFLATAALPEIDERQQLIRWG